MERERKQPTQLLKFSCESYDQEKFVKSRNNSHNRSQIFYANRQDYWQEHKSSKKVLAAQLSSSVKIGHEPTGAEEEAAIARGRR